MAETLKLKEGDVKIGTKEESFWTRVNKDAEASLKRLKDEMIFTEALIKMSKAEADKESKK